jgi:hypothetical protein
VRQDQLEDLCAHVLGRNSRRDAPRPLRLLLRHVLSFFTRLALGDARPRSHLLGQHFLEHQRHLSQLHSQSIFPLAAAQSLVQYSGVDQIGFSQMFYE